MLPTQTPLERAAFAYGQSAAQSLRDATLPARLPSMKLPDWEFPLRILSTSYGVPFTGRMHFLVQRAFSNGALDQYNAYVREDRAAEQREEKRTKLPKVD